MKWNEMKDLWSVNNLSIIDEQSLRNLDNRVIGLDWKEGEDFLGNFSKWCGKGWEKW